MNLNEIITVLSVYHLFCFTEFVLDGETKAVAVGNSMIFITFLNLIVNIAPIVPELWRSFKSVIKKTWHRL